MDALLNIIAFIVLMARHQANRQRSTGIGAGSSRTSCCSIAASTALTALQEKTRPHSSGRQTAALWVRYVAANKADAATRTRETAATAA